MSRSLLPQPAHGGSTGLAWSASPITQLTGMDCLPWFLQQMKAEETSLCKRLLDYLDIHYYFQPDTSANDAAAEAIRLRMTQSLWNTSYVDESWIATSNYNSQSNYKTVWVIPSMQQLINQYYPGTKLSIGGWASTADGEITGGLVTADRLGIFGRYGVGSATVQAEMAENIEGIFGSRLVSRAARSLWSGSTRTLCQWPSLQLPTGKYFVRQFGGAPGNAKPTTFNCRDNPYTAIPTYTALFMKQV
ncbi:hypothetical protein FS837_007760 [Tulasnella sp. UAMH 9824]|nr:hypothetical protein FS837_007760 [Tulasnella sp. UAMH 9824]